jgi:IS30 family transposase
MGEPDKHLKLLEDIKKLLILDLLVKNVQTTEIANILGVNKSTISRLVPSRKLKK